MVSSTYSKYQSLWEPRKRRSVTLDRVVCEERPRGDLLETLLLKHRRPRREASVAIIETTEMPRRTRQHKLETESRLAFERVLGDRFVFRPEDPDYGIDGSVEEFELGSGKATGLRFFVQLKATDETDFEQARRVWLSLGTADYYRALPLPLLMVRYQTSSGRIFTRWFHQFDPYYGGLGEKGITFRWETGDAWNQDRQDELVADARVYALALAVITSPRLSPSGTSAGRRALPECKRD